MEYLFFLVFFVLFLAVIAFSGQILGFDNRFKLIAIFVLLVLVASFFAIRPFDFPDTYTYSCTYNAVDDYSYSANVLEREPYSDMEYGYVYIMLFFHWLGFNFEMFSFCISLFSMAVFMLWIFKCMEYLGISYTKYKMKCSLLVPFVIYLMMFGIEYNLVQMRTLLSVSVCLLGYIFLFNKKTFCFFVMIFIGFCIHRMAIIELIPYLVFLCNKNVLPKIIFVLLWFISLIFMIIETRYSVFWDSTSQMLFALLADNMGINYSSYNVSATNGIAKNCSLLTLWINGIMFWSLYKENIKNTLFMTIYLLLLFIVAFLCNLDAVIRIVDLLSIWLMPMNVYCFYVWTGNNISRCICYLFLLLMYLLLPFRMFFMEFSIYS